MHVHVRVHCVLVLSMETLAEKKNSYTILLLSLTLFFHNSF